MSAGDEDEDEDMFGEGMSPLALLEALQRPVPGDEQQPQPYEIFRMR